MTPIFYSQYSGKSLLTFQTPEKALKNNKQSIAKICLDNKIEKPVIVDSSLTGIMELFQSFHPLGLKPRFGLSYKFVHENNEENKNNWHKIIIFIKNLQGYRDLIKIHNTANIRDGGRITTENLKTFWTENLKLAIPFYDSYIFKNTMYDCSCYPEFNGIQHSYFVEDNGLPFDNLIASKVLSPRVNVKTILYENRKDFRTWLVYRCALNFSNKGKNRSLESPMFDHCHSKEFSFESYLEELKNK